jgi:hypothetical protein
MGLTAWAAAGNESFGFNVDAIVPVFATSRIFPIFKAPNSGSLSLDLGLRWLYIVLNLQTYMPRTIWGGLRSALRIFFSSPQLDKALMHVPVCDADAMVTGNGQSVEFFQVTSPILHLRLQKPIWRYSR